MGQSERVRAGDAQRLIHLVLDLQELPADRAARKDHLLNGVCDLLGGRVGTWGEFSMDGPKASPRPTTLIDLGWESVEQRAVFAEWVAEHGFSDPMSQHVFACDGDRKVIRRSDVVTDEDWYRSLYCEYRRAANLDDLVGLRCSLKDRKTVLTLSVQRSWGDRKFCGADASLLKVLNETLERVYRQLLELPHDALLERLSPRLRQTLERLLEGDSEKQIALTLGLSGHTVHDYVKSLYGHFEVSSRGELLARFIPGDGLGAAAASDGTR